MKRVIFQKFAKSLAALILLTLTSGAAVAAQKVLCSAQTSELAVMTQNLKNIAFRVEPYEPLKVFQGSKDSKVKSGKSGNVTYVKVQFPDLEDEESEKDDSIGWIVESLVKNKSDCEGAKDRPESEESEEVDVKSSPVTGLTSENCCGFPLEYRPLDSYTSGMRRFGARRSGGRRLHAACDLYQENSAKVIAVENGKILKDIYFFYQGTFALEVKHVGGFVVRYGEIKGKVGKGVSAGKSVNRGQHLGYVQKVNSGCCSPMLHFELYTGKMSGPLSQRHANKYQRRADLINPTRYLQQWEEKAL
jgi:murein DD-endopeptidase MepM/ murein hydrolase activator NlpD